ncbi:CvpA family protein [Zymomonas mobilis]|uniref:Colicin V production protein n=1 Tax=Zymomonas mobilis subsp. pomaceae (strain ATCC 29192 / DSM 22645 / JCM 10191 / CCUG 17912 / NBRC 13757 / NCIMB 11200 / NRRL B-4491 / Barker I) TaxID=579138 RepID=F8ERS3_ZYMMT|nr:CvpA family protein [Zymomonas mobilis]AEI37531.1 Colicin V production protein [Zymomonas mobilis subsp. pomaceae ATCC 29192]MDX5948899.1 CvpA family protein [Zymomonas mobilis subsp. pomaceae]GEB88705.1 hypothetical protein ZMO02_03420 [Zymomonas mobilis subsp. pomaceae]
MANFHPVDLMVMALLVITAFMGFWRGFIGAALSLFSWIAAIIAVRMGHIAVASQLHRWLGVGIFGSSLIAFVLLFVVVYFLGQWLSDNIGAKVRRSFLAFPDRVLGGGFGLIKGAIIAECLFLMVILANSTFSKNYKHRPPLWLASAVSYPWLKSGSSAILDYTGFPDPLWLGSQIRQSGQEEKNDGWPSDKVIASQKRLMRTHLEDLFFAEEGECTPEDQDISTSSPPVKKKMTPHSLGHSS